MKKTTQEKVKVKHKKHKLQVKSKLCTKKVNKRKKEKIFHEI